jgi:hypothetical protein
MGYKLLHFVIFQFLTMFDTIVGAGAATRYGSDQMMRFLAASAPQHWFKDLTIIFMEFQSLTKFKVMLQEDYSHNAFQLKLPSFNLVYLKSSSKYGGFNLREMTGLQGGDKEINDPCIRKSAHPVLKSK